VITAVASAPGVAVSAATTPLDLAVRGLRKGFGDGVPVLRDVTVAVARGEAVSLIGANGAGKSTLLRACLRLIEPDAGSVELLGREVTTLAPEALRHLRAQVGVVFQRHNLVPRLSVLSNVVHGAQARAAGPRTWFQALAPQRIRAEAMHCLELVGLTDLARRRADQLSGGESQRVAIARAFMQRPRLMLADEPVASLDPSAGEAVMRLFVDLLRRQRMTLLFTSHNLRHAVEYADRVVGLRHGRVELDAPAAGQDLARLREIYA
jgi:phosphonate transport system ATP-binding protein